MQQVTSPGGVRDDVHHAVLFEQQVELVGNSGVVIPAGVSEFHAFDRWHATGLDAANQG